MAAYKRAVLRDSVQWYNILYLSLMPGSNMLYQKRLQERLVETLDMPSALSIDVFRPKQDPLVAIALSLPLTKVSVTPLGMWRARKRFMKHCARVCRYKHRDHLPFWTSFHVPGRRSRLPVGGDTTAPPDVHLQRSRTLSFRW